MAVVTLNQNGYIQHFSAQHGQTIMSFLQENEIYTTFPCGGNHTCGKCVVRAEGALSPISEQELALLPVAADKLRLACFAEITGDCRIILCSAAEQQIAQEYTASFKSVNPIYTGEYGVAVDIGTTTVVVYLFKRRHSQPLASIGRMNVQSAYGSDVLSRISYCDVHGVKGLQELIVNQIDDMMLALCVQSGIKPEEISGACITGNTTMLHILTGLNPHGLGIAPFRSESFFGTAFSLDFLHFPSLECFLPPCISAYVGGDIVCSMLAANLMEQTKTTLLIDVGTNGEMALKHGSHLYCCSTAAGPAFEGANISCGMQACNGAIHKVWSEGRSLQYAVLGDTKAKGLCGSGLIDAVAAARDIGLLNKRGVPTDKSGILLVGESGISLSSADIQELLLAKAAIRAGIEELLDSCGISDSAVEQVILCGGFGSFLRAQSAVRIGLLPSCFRDITSAIGNAAGAGAGIILQDRSAVAKSKEISDMAENIDLSGNSNFYKRYIRAAFLP